MAAVSPKGSITVLGAWREHKIKLLDVNENKGVAD